jgi:hypothetical protein
MALSLFNEDINIVENSKLLKNLNFKLNKNNEIEYSGNSRWSGISINKINQGCRAKKSTNIFEIKLCKVSR